VELCIELFYAVILTVSMLFADSDIRTYYIIATFF